MLIRVFLTSGGFLFIGFNLLSIFFQVVFTNHLINKKIVVWSKIPENIDVSFDFI